MESPINNIVVGGMILIFIFSIVFILAIVDGALPFYWKIFVGGLSLLVIFGVINVMKQQQETAKRYMNNREDLR